MSKPRITDIKQHGPTGLCITLKDELEKLGWKKGDNVRVQCNSAEIVITHEEEVTT